MVDVLRAILVNVFFERPAEIGTPKQTDRLFEGYCMVRCVKDTLSLVGGFNPFEKY